ncbi:MAG: hypothetical protein H7Z39_01775, partial [Burkholderiaceae bacterium]|nr:hypothetical protein [Burkholderiaceae bacterium]
MITTLLKPARAAMLAVAISALCAPSTLAQRRAHPGDLALFTAGAHE